MNKVFTGSVCLNLLVFSFSALPANAANVSMIIIDTGLDGKKESSLAGIWESGIMDVLFDSGYVVSNAQSIQIDKDLDENVLNEIRLNMEEASDNGADYFLSVTLHYTSTNKGINNTKDFKLNQVTLKLFELKTNEMIYERTVEKPLALTQRDELENARKAALIIVPYIGGRV
jgi:hypothetical protein